MIFEKINFLARHKFESLTDVKEFKQKLDNNLPELKGKRENLWRKYKKVISTEDKENITTEFNKLNDEIDTLHGQRNACKRIIVNYESICEEYNKAKIIKKQIEKLILNNSNVNKPKEVTNE